MKTQYSIKHEIYKPNLTHGLGWVSFNTCDRIGWVGLNISQPNKVELG